MGVYPRSLPENDQRRLGCYARDWLAGVGLNKGLKINLLHSCSHRPGAAELPAPSLAGLLSSEVELLPAPLQGVLAVSGDAHRVHLQNAHRVVVSVVQPRETVSGQGPCQWPEA